MTSIKDFTKRVFGTSKLMTAVAVVLIGSSIVLGGVFVLGWANQQQKQASPSTQPSSADSGDAGASDDTSTTPVPTPQSGASTYSRAQVAEHSTASDCWMIIDASVYNLTDFVGQHPGGAATLSAYCGKDGTQAFATMGRNRGTTHSQSASALKEDYKIGTIAD